MDSLELKSLLDRSLILLPKHMDSVRARISLTVIALQESQLIYRRQIKGPARGLWQFEEGGGVKGVLHFSTTQHIAADVCEKLGVGNSIPEVYSTLEFNDILACCMARLLLYTDAKPLPEVGEVDAMWRYYVANWRPGKPHPQKWGVNYATALELLL